MEHIVEGAKFIPGIAYQVELPVIVHKDNDSDYGVTVPDIPGCFTSVSDLKDLSDALVEAVQLHIDGLLDDREPFVLNTTDVDELKNRPDLGFGEIHCVELVFRNEDTITVNKVE